MSKKVIACNTAPSAIGTYSQAITVDKFTFISGQIPLDYKNMSIIEGTFEDQVAVVLNNLKNIAKDLASLGEIKARLMASKKLNSLNYSIDVVNNIAYISGIASSEDEISLVTQIAQEARFIKEVQNFVKVNKDKR